MAAEAQRRGGPSGIVDWCFRDRTTGRIVIGQFPNVPLWIFIGAVVARRFVSASGGTRTVVDAVGVAALGWWAVLEVTSGVNPWRRLLGGWGVIAAVGGAVRLVS